MSDLPRPALPAMGTAPETLVTVLDRLLDTGVVADGQLVLSVAGVDLIFVGLRALVASMDTAQRMALAPLRPAIQSPAGASPTGVSQTNKTPADATWGGAS